MIRGYQPSDLTLLHRVSSFGASTVVDLTLLALRFDSQTRIDAVGVTLRRSGRDFTFLLASRLVVRVICFYVQVAI